MSNQTSIRTAEEIQQACAIIDGPRGQSDYNDSPREYPDSSELLNIGADVVALATLKSTILPDSPTESHDQYQDHRPADTYEYLLEEAYLAYVNFAVLSNRVAQGLDLEALRIAFATTHDFDRALTIAVASMTASTSHKAPTSVQ
jgi:hypothetical protein